jgi:hypothetical protein
MILLIVSVAREPVLCSARGFADDHDHRGVDLLAVPALRREQHHQWRRTNYVTATLSVFLSLHSIFISLLQLRRSPIQRD